MKSGRGIFITILLFTTIALYGGDISGLDPALWQNENKSSELIAWTQVSPGDGGTVWYLRIHPDDPDRVIQSCDMGGTYITTDGSRTYKSVNNPDWTFPRLHYLDGVDFCSAKPEIGYAVSDTNGAFRTDDKGLTWRPLDTGSLDMLYAGGKHKRAPLSTLAVNPDNPDELWVGLGWFRCKEIKGNRRLPNGIAYSRDGGKTWSHIKNAFPYDAMLKKIVMTPMAWGFGKVIIAATDMGVYVSRDDGASWVKKVAGLPHGDISDMDAVYDAASKKVVLAVSLFSDVGRDGKSLLFKGGVWRSFDLGEKWEDVTGNLRIPTKLLEEKSGKSYYKFKHTNIISLKLTWKEFLDIPENKAAYDLMLHDHKNQPEVFKGKWVEFNKHNRGRIDKDVDVRLKLTLRTLPDFHNVRIDPRNPDIIYTSIHALWEPFGVWKTVDGGKNWICTVRGAQGWQDPAWSVYRPKDSPVFNVEQIWTSKHPMNWGAPGLDFGLWDVRVFDLSKSSPDVLYFHTHRVTYRSDDGGATWKDASNHFVPGTNGGFMGNGNSNMCVFDLAFHPEEKNKILFWMADCGIKTSNDAGVSFHSVKDASFGTNQWVVASAFDPNDSGRFYSVFGCRDSLLGLGGTYFLESRDFGKSCEGVSVAENGAVKLPPKMTAFDFQINNLLVDPRSPADKRHFIAAHATLNRYTLIREDSMLLPSGSKGIFISEDGGKTWMQSNKGLGENLNIVDLVADPRNFDVLYASLVMRIKDAGKGEAIPGGLFISRDSGRSWAKASGLPLINASRAVLAEDGSIYVSGGYGKTTEGIQWDNNGGVYRSSDSGRTWERLLAAPCVSCVAVCPSNPKLVYCAVDSGNMRPEILSSGIFRSGDGGKTWFRVNRGLATNSRFTTIRFNPHVKGEVWIGTYGSGYYKAIDPEG